MKNLDPILAIAQQSSSHMVPSKQTATKPRRIIQQSRTMSSWSISIIRWVIWPYPTNLYPLTTFPHKYPTYRKHHPASSNQLEHSHGLSHQSERATDVIQPIRTQSLRPYIYPIRTSKEKNCWEKLRKKAQVWAVREKSRVKAEADDMNFSRQSTCCLLTSHLPGFQHSTGQRSLSPGEVQRQRLSSSLAQRRSNGQVQRLRWYLVDRCKGFQLSYFQGQRLSKSQIKRLSGVDVKKLSSSELYRLSSS